MARELVNTVLDNMRMTMTPYMIGDGKPLVELVSYTKTDFEGKSPVGILVRNNTRIRRLTARAIRTIYRLNMNFFVMRVDPGNEDYTEAMAEYAINHCTEAYLQWLDENRSRADLGWQNVTLEQDSFLREVVDDGGHSYWMETYMMEVESW